MKPLTLSSSLARAVLTALALAFVLSAPRLGLAAPLEGRSMVITSVHDCIPTAKDAEVVSLAPPPCGDLVHKDTPGAPCSQKSPCQPTAGFAASLQLSLGCGDSARAVRGPPISDVLLRSRAEERWLRPPIPA